MRRRQLLLSTSMLAAAAGAPIILHAATRGSGQFRALRLPDWPLQEQSRLEIVHTSGAPAALDSNGIDWAQLDLIGAHGRELRLWRMTRGPVLNRGRELSLPLANHDSVQIRLRYGRPGSVCAADEQQLRLVRGESVVLVSPDAAQSDPALCAAGVACREDAIDDQSFCAMLTVVAAETIWLRLS